MTKIHIVYVLLLHVSSLLLACARLWVLAASAVLDAPCPRHVLDSPAPEFLHSALHA